MIAPSVSLNAMPVSTNAMFLSACVFARTMRAYCAQLTTAMAIITLSRPLPSTVITAMDMIIGGMDHVRSARKERTRSTPPP